MMHHHRSNENFIANNEPKFDVQSPDLPPPPPHILALSSQNDISSITESTYIMPPPPSIVSPEVTENIYSPNDSTVPPPMPIINPPRQSSALSTPKIKSSPQPIPLIFSPPLNDIKSSLHNSSLMSTVATNNSPPIVNYCNTNKTTKVSTSVLIPPRLSSIISVAKPSLRSIDTTNKVQIYKSKALPPPLTIIGNRSSNLNTVSSDVMSGAKDATYCAVCGHVHDQSVNHAYCYREQVDTELLCQICHQPLVEPLETKCGHTFCTMCLKSHLVVQALCPEDKQIINYLECSPASNIVKRLLDKLLIICPNTDSCSDILPRSELEAHLLYWCKTKSVQANNSCTGTPFQISRNQLNSVKSDSGFEKSPNPISKTTDYGIITEHISSSNVNNIFDETLFLSSSSSDSNNKSHSRIVGATSLNQHKNTVRFDPVPQTRKKHHSTNDEFDDFNENLLSIIIDRTGNSDLGISFVGGTDTPLQCIIIQEIYLDGAVAKDNRLRPGDQIISLNDIDLNQVTHLHAKTAFLQTQQQSSVCRLLVYRERADETLITEKEDILQFCLSKREDKKLGIKLVGQKNKPGLYVLDLLKGSEADLDGRLRKNDRILSINGIDLKMATQDIAANVINGAEAEVKITVSRIIRPQTPDLIRTTGSDHFLGDFESVSPPSGPIRKSNVIFSPIEKVVTVEKNYDESLGISVAGGVNSQRGDTPIYVTNIAQEGVLTKTQKVNKGDILISVNEIELLGLSHEKAVESLKAAGQKCRKVTVRLLQGPETAKIDGPNFLPSWVYWLQLPRYCEIPHFISLKRDSVTGSLGFSIVGGIESEQLQSNERYGVVGYCRSILHQQIIVKSIVTGSVAHRNGRLKCGDILLKLNNISLVNVSHEDAVSLFKNVQEDVMLQVVSWPGTIV